MKLCYSLLAASLLLVTAVHGQEVATPPFAISVTPIAPAAKAEKPSLAGVTEIIRGKFPLAIEFKELTGLWRDIDYNGTHYYTKGEVFKIADTEYLVAYTFRGQSLTQLNGASYVSTVTRGITPQEPDDKLDIALIELRSVMSTLVGGQTNLHSYNSKRLVTGFDVNGKPAAYYQNLSLVYLKKLRAAFQGYSSAYLNTLPTLETAFAARQELEPFAENAVVFTQPGTTLPFRFNPLLSGRKRAHLKGMGQVILAYEGTAAADGSRAILQYSGRVARVSGKEWEKLRTLSRIDEGS